MGVKDGSFVHYWWTCVRVHPFWKVVWPVLIKRNMYLSYVLIIELQSIYFRGSTMYNHIKLYTVVLAGVAQWIEHWPGNHRIAGSIPSQGTCLGCGPGPQ